jgi:hypothetical protein
MPKIVQSSVPIIFIFVLAFSGNLLHAQTDFHRWNFDIDGGITYKLASSGARFFADVRYHRISTSPRVLRSFPITFGICW